jgi:hypothetical protein
MDRKNKIVSENISSVEDLGTVFKRIIYYDTFKENENRF